MAKVVLPIERGDVGRAVHDVQVIVHAAHDGIFGSRTEDAVKDWQRAWNKKHPKAHPLTVDGIVGPKTWAAMHPLAAIVKKPVVVPNASTLSPGEAMIVRYVKFSLGGKYVFGAEIHVGEEWKRLPLDCSEMTQVAYRLAHAVEPKVFPLIPDGSYNQHATTRSLGFHKTAGSLLIGDLGFLHEGGTDKGRVHHVGIKIGGVVVGEAKGRAYGVVSTTVDAFNKRGADWHRARTAA